MILVVSHGGDVHATEVTGHLGRLGADVHVLDLADFPVSASLSIAYDDPEQPVGIVRSADGVEALDVTGTTAVWWRRPMPFALPEMPDAETFTFTYNEWDEAITGLWQLTPGFWINEPARDVVAARKAYQLREAARSGLPVPRTLITSDPARAIEFVDQVGRDRTIYKVFSATQHTWRETRLLRESELSMIDRLRLAPVIFQEYVPADVDLRITIVGDHCFPAAIHSQDADYKVDFRMEMDGMQIEPATLPEEIELGLKRMMGRLGLVYGAVDMRRTPSGDYVFLEVNTAGQWLFVEYATGQPIAETLARTLLGVGDSRCGGLR